MSAPVSEKKAGFIGIMPGTPLASQLALELAISISGANWVQLNWIAPWADGQVWLAKSSGRPQVTPEIGPVSRQDSEAELWNFRKLGLREFSLPVGYENEILFVLTLIFLPSSDDTDHLYFDFRNKLAVVGALLGANANRRFIQIENEALRKLTKQSMVADPREGEKKVVATALKEALLACPINRAQSPALWRLWRPVR